MNNLAFENGSAVQTTDFNHSALDSPEDVMREMLLEGKSAKEVIEAISLDIIEHAVGSHLAVFLATVLQHKRPLFFIDQLCWLSGVALMNGETLITLAKKHGVTKQAFQQACKRANEEYKFPPTRAQRSAEAKKHMREAYFKTKP